MAFEAGQHNEQIVAEVLRKLEEVLLAQSDFLYPLKTHAEPPKPRVGQIFFADGTDWDPGCGEGAYMFNSAGEWEPMMAKQVQILDENGDIINLQTDTTTDALNVVDYAHHEIHSGSHFNYRDYYNIAKNGNKEFLIVTPDTTKWAHMVIGFEAVSSQIVVQMFEGAVTTDDGTLEPIVNRNRNSIKTNDTLLYEDPTLISDGTELLSGIFGSGKNSSGGQSRDQQEMVLKQNTKYLVRVTEQNVAATDVNILFDWYEHTDRT